MRQTLLYFEQWVAARHPVDAQEVRPVEPVTGSLAKQTARRVLRERSDVDPTHAGITERLRDLDASSGGIGAESE